jgi:CheY-like chemotaxis protein
MAASSVGEERLVKRGLRVLVVEDNRDGRETLQALLELHGCRVEVAEDGLEGVDKALAWRPDAAVVDIGLPRLDGYQVAERIRSALGPAVFLITLTSYGRAEDRARSQAAGFDVHLVKPVDPQHLCDWLEKVAAGKAR